MDNTVTSNIVKKMGQAVDPAMQQPGMLTSTLTSALKSLDTYIKMAGEQDPKDPDISLVRKIVVAISALIQKDQSEGQGGEQGSPQSPDQGMMGGGMDQGSIMGRMGGGDMMSGAPQQPDLDSIVRGGGGMMG